MTDIPSLKERRARPLGCLAPVDLAGLFPRSLLLKLAAAIWGFVLKNWAGPVTRPAQTEKYKTRDSPRQ
jgi:hypothetical protein